MGRCGDGMAWFWPVPLVALGCSWWDWEEHLSFLSPRFGVWMGGLQGCTVTGGQCGLVGHARESPFVGRTRLGVGGGVGNCGQVRKTRKEKKKSKGATLACAWPKLVQPSQCRPVQAWVQSGPTCLHSEFNHQLCCTLRYATYSPAISPNSKIRKPPAPVPALACVCVPCACACAPSCL